MSKIICSFLIVFASIANAEMAKIKIKKAPFRQPSQSMSDAYMANSSFVGFLKCTSDKEAEELKCIKRYFSPKTNEAMILRYSEALHIAGEYTELYYCDDEQKQKIEVLFPEKDYDFFLCFQSDIKGEKSSEGTAFFEKGKGGMPKIVRLRM